MISFQASCWYQSAKIICFEVYFQKFEQFPREKKLNFATRLISTVKKQLTKIND